MSDPTKLSDAELLAALNGGQPAAAASGVSAMSDADLLKALGQPTPVAAAPQGAPSTTGDMVQSFGSGVLKGAIGLAGLPGDAARFIGSLSDAAAEKITGEKLPQSFKENRPAQALGATALRKNFEGVTGTPLYEPQTTAGKYAGSVGEFLPGAAAGPGGVAYKAIANALLPGLATEAAGQATEGTAAEPFARIAAALATGAAPALGRKIVTPLPIAPERQAMADALMREGVPLTAGQKTGSKPLLYAESALGDAPFAGARSAETMAAQGEAFTDAAMRRAGATGRGPDALAANNKRLGDTFEDLSARNTLQADPQLGNDINAALQTYGRKLPSEQKAIVGNEAVEIIQRLQTNGGVLPGREYQTIRSDLSRRAKSASDPEFGRALRGLRDSLDDAMARSISPEDAAAWQTARQEYGAQKTLEKASAGAGSDAAFGIISPAQLRVAASAGNRGAYSRGEGDFAELARAGAAMMTPLPNSGTAQRQLMTHGLGGGAITAGLTGNVPLAAALAFGPGVAGRALYSKPVQAYLGNQALAGPKTPAIEQIARALLSAHTASGPARYPR